MKLPGGCGDMLGKTVRFLRSLVGLKQSGRRSAGLLVETVVEHGMEQYRTGTCVVSHGCGCQGRSGYGRHVDAVVIVGSDKTCNIFHVTLIKTLPTTNFGELTSKRNWELRTLYITQKVFIESMSNHFSVNSSSDIPAIPGAELDPREKNDF